MVFVDATGAPPPETGFWEPIVVKAADIEAEVARLASLPVPADGQRRSLVAHPSSSAPGNGLAPGIEVSIDVLLPGEEARPPKDNATRVDFCIRGQGTSSIEGRELDYGRYDVFCTPSMATRVHRNTGDEVQVRIAYSNAALLRSLGVHFTEPEPAADDVDEDGEPGDGEALVSAARADVLELSDGARLMTYERLVSPPEITSPVILWRWDEVRSRLDELAALGPEYRGRRLYLLYNPMTGRTNGTTCNFFATMTIRPPDIVDRPHRHIAAAINYYFAGSGWSRVAGKKYEWEAGDLMLSAPGWAIHHHASGPDPVYELTVQDSPLHLAMDSLVWQEDLKQPPILIGSHPGWATNRAALERP